MQAGAWSSSLPNDVPPLLVTRRSEEAITPIYLATSHDEPKPATEAKALLLLRPSDIHQLATQSMTLSNYLEAGGKAIFRERLPQHLTLEPLGHLFWLDILLHLHPEIACTNQCCRRATG